jgi:hypothetical protein
MFYAFLMRIGGDIDYIQGFPTEVEADSFGVDQTRYSELHPMDDPNHWTNYDPPIVILVECDESDQLFNGKYKRPVAIYQRGEKFVCVKV